MAVAAWVRTALAGGPASLAGPLLGAGVVTFVALVLGALLLARARAAPGAAAAGARRAQQSSKRRCTVVVLGDLGRSPRMQYHALSLATAGGFEVDVVSARGRPPREDVAALARDGRALRLHALPPAWRPRARLLYLAWLPLRVVLEAARLAWALLVTARRPDVILLQTPPAPPAMTACWLAARLRGARLVIDWHNLGYTLLALKLGKQHVMTRAYRWYEHAAGGKADAHLCVTREMESWLRREGVVRCGADVGVLYDRPPAFFRRRLPAEAEALAQRLAQQLGDAAGEWLLQLTRGAEWSATRPALLVSSTSWTPDEDLNMLLDAALLYEQSSRACDADADGDADAHGRMPRVLLLVTGEGPLRAAFEARVSEACRGNKLGAHVRVATAWLEAEDYPALLGCADAGVSMHASSSGIDLPMKAVDMLGAGAPVMALRYRCIEELVPDGVRGVHFDDSQGLAQAWRSLLAGFDGADARGGTRVLREMRAEAQQWAGRRWEDEWAEEALPLLS